MKSFKQISVICILVFSITFAGCTWENERILPQSTGKTGDLLVVLDSASWSGNSGLEIRKCFSAPQDGLPQSEPVFNVIYVPPVSFGKIFRTTKNIVLFEIGEKMSTPAYSFNENVWASNQLVLRINARSSEEAAKIIANSCEGILKKFQEKEWQRLQAAFAKIDDEMLLKRVESGIGLRPHIPSDYKVALEKENFLWFRKDFVNNGHQISMGLIFYLTPYDSVQALEPEYLVKVRNENMKIVEGPSKGSYMTTYSEYKPAERELNVKNKFVIELRGLWKMQGDFMGGPFVHYAFIHKDGKSVAHIDGYVFAPKFDKREYLRELEAIAISAVD